MQTTPTLVNSFTALDWALVAIVLISTLMAFNRGLIRVLFSFGGLIAGILLAAWEYTAFARFLSQWILNLQTAQIVAFLLILVAVTFVFGLAGGALRKAARTIGLGFLDRLGGALFGLARGMLLGVALLMAVAAFIPESTWAKKSTLAPYFLAAGDAVSFVVPKDFQQQITKGAGIVLHETPELMRPHTFAPGT